ncbi:MAG: IS200/IS605 family transposase [Phycisphaeraceae bacterium]|nr:IS200/IS605 family transposase [Phycisphaeraceae bacterium]MBX3408030.1 IS200/IS605 family transposase [Phycisphaeraceae bacterium]
MPRNVYWELHYHFVWRTKDNSPMLAPAVEQLTHKFLVHRALQTPEAIVHAVGGIEDHVHMAVSLPPTVQLAEWVGDLKGATSHHINHGPSGPGALAWQTGYGVVSFGKRDLPWVVEYVRNQREHHAAGRVQDRLERITQMEVSPPEGEPC